MKFETLQKIAAQLLGDELKVDDTIESSGSAYSVAGYYLTETDKPIVVPCIGGERDTGRKFWELGASVYDSGDRIDPPSEDYVVLGEFESLSSCLQGACEHDAKQQIANVFQNEAESEVFSDEEIY